MLTLYATALVLMVVLGTLLVYDGLVRPPRRGLGSALGRGYPADPAEMGLSYREHVFTLPDGAESPAWIIDGGDPAGPIVVLSHGYGSSRYFSQRWAACCWPNASKMVVYDLRGHGECTDRFSTNGATKEPRDLLAIMEQLAEELEPEAARGGFVLWGGSMGAGVSLVAAVLSAESGSDRVRGVIVDGVYRHRWQPMWRYLWQRRWPPFPFPQLAELIACLLHQSAQAYDRLNWASRLGVPLLVLHGDADGRCPLEGAKQIAEAAPNAEIVVFPGGGHLDLLEVEERRYLSAVDRHFKRLPDRPEATLPTQREAAG